MYSISWLLQRAGKKAVQDAICELPDFLHKHSLSPASQKRRYPFASSPSHPLSEQREAGQMNSMDKFDFAEQRKNGDMDNSISQAQQRIFHSQEEARKPNHHKNVFTPKHNGNNEHDIQLGHHENLILPALMRRPPSPRKVAKAKNLQSVHSHASPKFNPKNRLLKKEDFLYNEPVENRTSLHTASARSNQPSESSPPGLHRQVKNVPRGYDFRHKGGNKVSHVHPAVAREFSRKFPADTYNADPPPSSQQKLYNSKPVRFSISSLTSSERQQLDKKLYEKLKNYSVAPHKLTYASMSTSKVVVSEIKRMGYIEVPLPNPNDFTLTMEEKMRLICQHEIRKHYLCAVFKANEKVRKAREYLKNRKKIPKYNSSQYF